MSFNRTLLYQTFGHLFSFLSLNRLFLKDIISVLIYEGYHLKRAKIHLLVLKLKWFLPRLALQLNICISSFTRCIFYSRKFHFIQWTKNTVSSRILLVEFYIIIITNKLTNTGLLTSGRLFKSKV